MADFKGLCQKNGSCNQSSFSKKTQPKETPFSTSIINKLHLGHVLYLRAFQNLLI